MSGEEGDLVFQNGILGKGGGLGPSCDTVFMLYSRVCYLVMANIPQALVKHELHEIAGL